MAWSRRSAATRALDGLDLSVAARRGARLPRPQRRRQVHDDPGPARAAPQGRGRGAAVRRRPLGARPPTLHRRLAYVPGDVSLWPNLSGGEVIDMLLRMRGATGRPPAPRRAARAVRARPDQEGPRLLQGQPAEGRPGRGLRRADADLLVLDEPTSGPRPADGAGVRRVRRRAHGRAARPCCSPATSSARSSGWPTGSRSSARAGRSRPARLDEMRHLHRIAVRAEVVGAVPGPGRRARRARPGRRRRRWSRCTVEPEALPAVLDGADRGRRTHADQHAADARGAVPRRLPRRRTRRAMTGADVGAARLARLRAAARPGAASRSWTARARR